MNKNIRYFFTLRINLKKNIEEFYVYLLIYFLFILFY